MRDRVQLSASTMVPKPTMTGRPSIIVEVRLSGPCASRQQQIRQQLEKWLRTQFTHLRVGQLLDLSNLKCTASIEKVEVAGQTRAASYEDDTFHLLSENDLSLYLYMLHSDRDGGNSPEEGIDYESNHFTVTRLPHYDLEGLWSSLIYEERIAENALRTITRAVLERSENHTERVEASGCNNILLHGSPGSGKTSLALALAQKLSIRLNDSYENAKLLQIKSHVLFSKYFGDSAKRIGQLFELILQLSYDESQLLVVIFDEVETLASSRQWSSQANEVGDAIRCTNEMLGGLDQLRRRSNVVCISTSNLTSHMDLAFLDRFPYQQLVGSPNTNTAYEILRTAINGEIERGSVLMTSILDISTSDSGCVEGYEGGHGATSEDEAAAATTSKLRGTNLEVRNFSSPVLNLEIPSRIPDLVEARVCWAECTKTVSSELRRIASLGSGWSARKLKDLLAIARYKYTTGKPCALEELLEALEKVFTEQLAYSGEKRASFENQAPICARSEVSGGGRLDEEDTASVSDDELYRRVMDC